ncbi:MAG TPA: 50S ribosomal protein L6 [Saprospiraceae bacterium]|nr:50S ribosomal protein L6 [Saprospiraceae bacterium]
MSRIGNAPISIPSNVEISVDAANVVTVKGPKGSLTQEVNPEITVSIEDGTLKVTRPTNQGRHRAMHGLYRSLINNMVVGVTEGYVKELELVGVGYRASNKGNLLEIQVGYSHPIMFYIPDELKLETLVEKGKPPTIRLEGIDKQLIGQVAAKIRSFRKPEPYKGKGIKYKGEILRRKAGKTAAK